MRQQLAVSLIQDIEGCEKRYRIEQLGARSTHQPVLDAWSGTRSSKPPPSRSESSELRIRARRRNRA